MIGRIQRFFAWAALPAGAWAGGLMLLGFFFAAIAGPWLAPYDPLHQNLDASFAPPGGGHLLGTDQDGVDLLSQMLYGARLAFIISASVVLICATVGVTLGIIAGYFGGKVDEVIMRVVDVLMAFPGILLNIAIVAVVARPGVGVLIFALAINGWVGYARVARGQVLTLREREFVAAARCIGAPSWLIMRRYIFPNLLSPIMVQMTFAFGSVIMVEASLSFLGLGPQVRYTWGALLDQGTAFMWKTVRLAIIPGLAIMYVVLAANLLGDGLRDRFDPRRQRLRQ